MKYLITAMVLGPLLATVVIVLGLATFGHLNGWWVLTLGALLALGVIAWGAVGPDSTSNPRH